MSKEENISLKKILVPVDGSHNSLHAEEFVVHLAKKFASEVTVLHIVPKELIESLSSQTDLPTSTIIELRSTLEQKGHKIVRDATALYTEEQIPVEPRLIEYGNPAESILDACGGNDLVVMGGRGEEETEEFDLGSVAEKVARYSECPVLLIKNRKQPSKILVPVDGSLDSMSAIQYAISFAQKFNSHLTLLNVARTLPLILDTEQAKKASNFILENAKKLVEAEGLKPEMRIAFGYAAKMIAKIAEDEDYDLIIMGSRGQSGILRFLIGSVSDKVAHKAKTSVMLVK